MCGLALSGFGSGTPGEQSIGRAEICALLQCCLVARRDPGLSFVAYSDSAYAIWFLEQLPSDEAGGVSKATTDLDLCAWADVWRKPANLQVRKVKAHSDAARAPLAEARSVLGNHFADEAAKLARQSDMPWVYTLLEAIETRQFCQEEMLAGFLRYQCACADKTSRHSVPSKPGVPVLPVQANNFDALCSWQALRPRELRVVAWPALEEEWLINAPWSPGYTVGVWRWLVALRWPAAAVREPRLGGITWLELLVDAASFSELCPPIKVAGALVADTDVWTPCGLLHKVVLKDAILTFSATVRYLEQASGVQLLLATPHRRIRCLETLGCPTPRRGIVRPELAVPRLSGPRIQDVLSSSEPGEVLRSFARRALDPEFDSSSRIFQDWRQRTFHQKAGRRRPDRGSC